MTPPITFADLEFGDTFDFIQGDGSDTFYLRCTKVSPRRYAWIDTGHGRFYGQVRSVKVQVYHVERRPVGGK